MDLLPNEQLAAYFVERIGLERAYVLLDKIARRFDRRYQRACKQSFSPLNRESIRSTELEIELTYRLKIGIQIIDCNQTPQAAKQRILARRQARKTMKA